MLGAPSNTLYISRVPKSYLSWWMIPYYHMGHFLVLQKERFFVTLLVDVLVFNHWKAKALVSGLFRNYLPKEDCFETIYRGVCFYLYYAKGKGAIQPGADK